eukprot:3931187-Rhodomonas_salina.2
MCIRDRIRRVVLDLVSLPPSVPPSLFPSLPLFFPPSLPPSLSRSRSHSLNSFVHVSASLHLHPSIFPTVLSNQTLTQGFQTLIQVDLLDGRCDRVQIPPWAERFEDDDPQGNIDRFKRVALRSRNTAAVMDSKKVICRILTVLIRLRDELDMSIFVHGLEHHLLAACPLRVGPPNPTDSDSQEAVERSGSHTRGSTLGTVRKLFKRGAPVAPSVRAPSGHRASRKEKEVPLSACG